MSEEPELGPFVRCKCASWLMSGMLCSSLPQWKAHLSSCQSLLGCGWRFFLSLLAFSQTLSLVVAAFFFFFHPGLVNWICELFFSFRVGWWLLYMKLPSPQCVRPERYVQSLWGGNTLLTWRGCARYIRSSEVCLCYLEIHQFLNILGARLFRFRSPHL